MAKRESRMLALGTPAPAFRLPAGDGRMHDLAEFAAARLLCVAFICNHCPYVKHMLDGLVTCARDHAARGVAFVAINSNDAASYPEDSAAQMATVARSHNFGFPYLYDESQQVAKAYQAICTPDLFLFDADRKLVYRGQFDGSRPGNRVPVSGQDLRTAIETALRGEPVTRQVPSVGCSIKWRAGQEPEWA